jgi:tetratricopeptide (TPR) repeat protein
MIRKCFLAAVAAAIALPAVPAEARWVEVKTQHFVIYTDLSDGQAAAYAMQLERFDHLLRELANLPATTQSASDVVTVYAVPLATVQELARSNVIAGFYNSDVQSTLAVMPLSVPTEWKVAPFHVMFHEYTHHILMSTTEESYPSWLHEGFAEFFGTVRFKSDGKLILGEPPQMRGWALHRQLQMSLETLLDSDGKKLGDSFEDKYARGWLLTHYLLLGKKRPGQLDKYMKLVAAGVPSLEAGRQAFGPLNKLDGEINVYNRNGKFMSYAIPGNFPISPPTVRPLGACEAAIMPTRIRSAVGVTDKTAPKLVQPARAAAKNCSADAFVQRSLAEIEFDAKNNAEALAAAERALAAEPGNVMAMIYKGRVLARQSRWGEAREWFIKANHAEPNYALPLVLFYDTYTRDGATPSKAAVNALMRAIVLSPRDASVRLRVANQLIGEGDLALARKVLAPVAFGAHAKGDNKALEALKQIDSKASPEAVKATAKAAKWNEIGKE